MIPALSRNKLGLVIKKYSIEPNTKAFFSSDPHFDHTNIIRFCNRPFRSTSQMNTTILNNYNNTVGKTDTFFFLGDMTFGVMNRQPEWWLDRINGKIIYIKGNHDLGINSYSKDLNCELVTDILMLSIGNKEVMLIHNPDLIPQEWKGWVICGHYHNNNLKDYPFVNKRNKTINVGVEVTNYKPVSLSTILNIIGK